MSTQTVKGFLDRYKDSPLSDKLQGEWLKSLGKAQQWELFAEGYPDLINKDIELTCYSLQHRIATNDASAFTEARPLWFNARDMPESCTALFDALDVAGELTVEDVWTRLRLALEAGNVGVAKRINEYLPENEALNDAPA